MKVVIMGAGKVGRYVAGDLVARGHEVILIEQNQDVIARHRDRVNCTWLRADACEPSDLKGLNLESCDVMVAATGDDEDNIVTSLLAKQEFGIPRVIARVNHPNNQWLFNEQWGIDVAVSPPQILTSLVEEYVTVGDMVRLMTLERGKVSLVEFTLPETSPSAGKSLSELSLPHDTAIVAVVRGEHVIAPRPDTELLAGDELLALATPAIEAQLEELLAGELGGSDKSPG